MVPISSEAPTGKILIVDDHQVVLSGTIDILRQHYPDYELLTAKTAQEAPQSTASTQNKKPDKPEGSDGSDDEISLF